ncbi:hypothetical protein F5984_26080 [Rudanella paleaurantiibacter]|uniref:Uncharacterized protein n=1 Tax=Rudanella paleaurantiibacter TaxID=2614655 RepID=A0A7J5TRY2_9BACT|nr:hypothetical protein [Rudanella paleaurantiibacter]KAB7725509.1 hypothetical protein F5984_26080 [Rudanella paleaurantiibacter]
MLYFSLAHFQGFKTKRLQRDEIYTYYKLIHNRQPPACERIIFLNEYPMIDLTEFNLDIDGEVIEYKAIRENGTPILESEYQMAYQRAIQGEVMLIVNGQPQ